MEIVEYGGTVCMDFGSVFCKDNIYRVDII